MTSFFKAVSLRHANARSTTVTLARLDRSLVDDVLENCTAILRASDRSDPAMKEIARQVFWLRCSVQFTLLPFDTKELDLVARFNDVLNSAARVPDLHASAGELRAAVSALMTKPENGKYKAVTQLLANAPAETLVMPIGCYGRDPGLPDTLRTDRRVASSWGILRQWVGRQLIVTGSLRYLSNAIYAEMFLAGRSGRIDGVVYRAEPFVLSKYQGIPPIQGAHLVAKPPLPVMETADVSQTEDEREALAWVHEGAGEATNEMASGARMILFEDGRCLYVPQGRSVQLLNDEKIGPDAEVVPVAGSAVAAGDVLLFRSGAAGNVLGEDDEERFDRQMEQASDWRDALESLLHSAEPQEIAEAMKSKGAKAISLAHSIRQWSDGNVYGPGTRQEFEALIQVLAERGRLTVTVPLPQYIQDRWERLSELRTVKLRRGDEVRSRLLEDLRAAVKDEGITDLVIPCRVRDFELARVAAVDENECTVSASRLMILQEAAGS